MKLKFTGKFPNRCCKEQPKLAEARNLNFLNDFYNLKILGKSWKTKRAEIMP